MSNGLHKVSRETRLAYLISVLHQRLLTGRYSKTAWVRLYLLVIEWEREQTYRRLSGLSDNRKLSGLSKNRRTA